jgi:hypothetical protein
VAQAVSLGCYAQLYRRVLAALGARIRFRRAADVVLGSFFVSHVTPFGLATRHLGERERAGGLASGDLLFDLFSLDLVFLALRYQPGLDRWPSPTRRRTSPARSR